jgi:hypothetical protein
MNDERWLGGSMEYQPYRFVIGDPDQEQVDMECSILA